MYLSKSTNLFVVASLVRTYYEILILMQIKFPLTFEPNAFLAR